MANKKNTEATNNSSKSVPELDAIQSEGKVHKFSINKANILKNSITKIYTRPSAVIREHTSNAMQAIANAVEEGTLKAGKGKVTVSIVDNTITIEDNGTGMTLEHIKDQLSNMGGCKNTDGSKHGYWGTGTFSTVKIADEWFYDTLTKDGKGARVKCRGGITFEHLGESKRDSHGTTVTIPNVNLKKGDDGNEQQEIIDMLARFGNAPRATLSVKVGKDRAKTYKPTVVEDVCKKWAKAGCAPITYADDEIRITWRASPELYQSQELQHLTLLGTPIDATFEFPFPCYIDLLDERKFVPATSRDVLSTEAADLLQKKLTKILDDEVAKVAGIRSYEQYMAAESQNMALWYIKYNVTIGYQGKFETPHADLRRAWRAFVFTDGDKPGSIEQLLAKHIGKSMSYSPKLGTGKSTSDSVVICPSSEKGAGDVATQLAKEFKLPGA